jgi:capsular exopolysaccharide synthesis family protein
MDTDKAYKPKNSANPTQPDQGIGNDDEQSVDLAWVVSVIRRRAGVMLASGMLLTTLAGGLVVYLARKTVIEYQGSFRMLIEPVTAEGRLSKLSLLAQSGTSSNTIDISRIGVADSDLVDYETQMRVLKSPKLMDPLIEEVRAKYPDMNLTYAKLMANLKIERISYEKEGKQFGTKLLDVIFMDPDTEKVKFVLDRLADTFLKYSLQERLTTLRQGLQFIDSQLPQAQQRVNNLQIQMQQLREQYNLTYPDVAARGLGDQANLLESERIKAQNDLVQNRGIYELITREINRGNGVSVIAREWQSYQSLLGQLQSIDGQIASQSGQFLDNSPPIQALYDQRSTLLGLINEQARVVQQTVAGRIEELDARLQGINRQRSELNARVNSFADALRLYGDIERELSVATDSLKQLLSKREAIKLDASQREIPWEIISQPEVWLDKNGKPLPVETQKTTRTLAIVAVLSMLFGVGIGFIVEIMNTVFHTPEEVRGATKIRLIGVIPYDEKMKRQQRKLIRLAKRLEMQRETPEQLQKQYRFEESPHFIEAFRSLYTNIRLLSANNPIQSLVVSSALPGDGKSTVATQLAKTAASIGVRVLLVDGDLRDPQVHNRLGLPNKRGLGEAITMDLSLNDVIQRSPADENLFVLTAGRSNVEPIKLLSSDKMQYLMEQFQAFFDLVIYDSPPLVGLSDASILEASTDGLILVVNLSKTDRGAVKKAIDSLRVSGASVLGFVANGSKGKAPKVYSNYQKAYRREEVSL